MQTEGIIPTAISIAEFVEQKLNKVQFHNNVWMNDIEFLPGFRRHHLTVSKTKYSNILQEKETARCHSQTIKLDANGELGE